MQPPLSQPCSQPADHARNARTQQCAHLKSALELNLVLLKLFLVRLPAPGGGVEGRWDRRVGGIGAAAELPEHLLILFEGESAVAVLVVL